MSKESTITATILASLKRLPQSYFFKEHGAQYHSGEPDVVGCLEGRSVVIEVKQPGKRSRPAQLAVQARWRAAGAIVVVDATCWEDVRAVIGEAGLL